MINYGNENIQEYHIGDNQDQLRLIKNFTNIYFQFYFWIRSQSIGFAFNFLNTIQTANSWYLAIINGRWAEKLPKSILDFMFVSSKVLAIIIQK